MALAIRSFLMMMMILLDASYFCLVGGGRAASCLLTRGKRTKANLFVLMTRTFANAELEKSVCYVDPPLNSDMSCLPTVESQTMESELANCYYLFSILCHLLSMMMML
jgi:hypothetical protein